MKKTIIGGFLLIGGMIGIHGVTIAVASNLTDVWSTPPGRLLTTLMENGSIFPAILSFLLVICGLNILWKEISD